MKIKDIEFKGGRISKDYTIELPNGKEVVVNKWAMEETTYKDNIDYDGDTEIIEGQENLDNWLNSSKDDEEYDKFSDKWEDFLSEISVWNN